MQGKATGSNVQLRSGDSPLIATAGLLGALGDQDEFPQDRAGIEALVAGAARGPDGERLCATYEAPEDLPTYLGGYGTWVAPAGNGRLRLRQPVADVDRLVSRVWTLGPDGTLSDPETIEGYGVLDAELPERARAELEELERRRRDFEAKIPEMVRSATELTTAAERACAAARGKPKFRGKRYLRTLAAAPQPGANERILAIELYADGLIVEFTYDTDLSIEQEMESMYYPPRPRMRVEDDLGTEYYEGERAGYGGGPGASHAYFTFGPAVAAAARVLWITTDSGTVEVSTQA